MKKRIVLGILLLAAAVIVKAQETPRADIRQAGQHARIAEGRVSGEVTRGERAALKREQRHIRRTERRAKSDGAVTPRERAKLERKQDRANRHIRRVKHNKLSRPGQG